MVGPASTGPGSHHCPSPATEPPAVEADLAGTCTRTLALEPPVIQAWEAVALQTQQHDGWKLNGDDADTDADAAAAAFKSHADAIHHLKLSSQVIRPNSLLQVQTEQEIPDGAG